MPLNILLIGPPGVGKGTQAALLTQRLGLIHLSSGDVFRSEIHAETQLGQLVKKYIVQGQLVPDEVTIQMMEARIASSQARTSGFVLDGFPRTLPQAEALDDRMFSLGISFARIVSLEVPDGVVIKRIAGRRTCERCGEVFHVESKPPKEEGVCDNCGGALVVRQDDNEETTKSRLEVFHRQTEPILQFYESSGKIFRVDGNGTAEEVYARMVEGLPV